MLKGLLAISGQRGLFKMVSQAKNSIIVESLLDGKRIPAYATSRISALEDISIYTEEEDVKLADVFKAIYEKEDGGKAIDPKSSGNELKNYFEEILPSYDKDRVYVSDIKKVLTWYNILIENDLIDPNAVDEEAEEESESAE
ncbi:DUF5606 family protein [Carboxylicivirga linearis]|uniref:DUF5606 domain-containing protein n=1 Tax=Carboxylicivirga linearis TaxID=1628157 RepID=A0ABS5K041_9BACT|nr:DUF5606 domain-containing protein [Carboxylicivirga linearis]MBS2100036.1 DUF5606 domain-containing protein [Carboxylicivirga linearis]